MATKAKTTTKAAEKAFTTSTQVLQGGFDKALLGYDDFAAASKDNVEAVAEAVSLSQKGFEAINSEALAYSKQAMEDGVAATKAAFGAKSIQELIELNSEYTKAAFEAYMGTAAKIGELFTATAEDAATPLNTRVNAVVETAQNVAAK